MVKILYLKYLKTYCTIRKTTAIPAKLRNTARLLTAKKQITAAIANSIKISVIISSNLLPRIGSIRLIKVFLLMQLIFHPV